MRDRAKRMGQSPRYHRIGDAARKSLDETCAKYGKQGRDAKRSLDGVLDELAKYPLLEGPSSREGENIDVAVVDVDRLKEYVEEVKEWMSLMRALYRALWVDVR